jgi:hypothetical protein
LTDFEKYARLRLDNDLSVVIAVNPPKDDISDCRERRNVMGDKGGKKDKEKGQKQNAEKQKQNSKNKLDKQPKRKP